jgi:hypothetical protein
MVSAAKGTALTERLERGVEVVSVRSSCFSHLLLAFRNLKVTYTYQHDGVCKQQQQQKHDSLASEVARYLFLAKLAGGVGRLDQLTNSEEAVVRLGFLQGRSLR